MSVHKRYAVQSKQSSTVQLTFTDKWPSNTTSIVSLCAVFVT